MNRPRQEVGAAYACSVEDAAAYWVAHLHSPECTAANRDAYQDWLDSNPAHRLAYSRAHVAYALAKQAATLPQMLRLRAKARLISARKRRHVRLKWASAAAAAVLGFGVFWLLRGTRSPADVSRAEADTFQTGVGERSIVSLPDGSRVTLDTASRIRLAYRADAREIELLAGQALFEVAQNSRRPFIVTAANQSITALGTAFDVRVSADDMSVTLLEGRIAVAAQPRSEGKSPQPPTAASKVLEPGQQLSVRPAQPLRLAFVNLARVTSWRDGRLVFEHEPLLAAVNEINRYSVTQIVLADASLHDLKISGVFATGTPESFATAIETYFGLSLLKQANGREIVLRRRE